MAQARGLRRSISVTWASASADTLCVADASANTVDAITGPFQAGTAFAALAKDSGVASLVGTVDLTAGSSTPLLMGVKSPKGLLFSPRGQ